MNTADISLPYGQVFDGLVRVLPAAGMKVRSRLKVIGIELAAGRRAPNSLRASLRIPIHHFLAAHEYTVVSYSMRVKVTLQRERGESLPAYCARTTAGELYLTYRTSANRRVPVLQLLGAPAVFPNLYDPRLIELAGTGFRFVGFEPAGTAWVMQEWICELSD